MFTHSPDISVHNFVINYIDDEIPLDLLSLLTSLRKKNYIT